MEADCYRSSCSTISFARNGMTQNGRHYPAEYDVGTEYVTVTSNGENRTYKLSGFWNTWIDDGREVYIKK